MQEDGEYSTIRVRLRKRGAEMTEISNFRITGMHCTSCAKLIEMTLTDIEGVKKTGVDYEGGVGRVEFDPAVVSRDDITAAIRSIGYEASF